eukprot:Rmarinus@m.28074
MAISSAKRPNISGYSGFVPGVVSNCIYGQNYLECQHRAHGIAEQPRQACQPTKKPNDMKTLLRPQKVVEARRDSVFGERSAFTPEEQAQRRIDTSKEQYNQSSAIRVKDPKPLVRRPPAPYRMAGYSGYIPQMNLRSTQGRDFVGAQAHLKSEESVYETRTTSLDWNHDLRSPSAEARDEAQAIAHAIANSHEKVPGYGGFIPGLQARNVFGCTYASSQNVAEETAAYDHEKGLMYSTRGIPKTMPPQPLKRLRMNKKLKVAGYSGFVPHIRTRETFSQTFQTAQELAECDDGWPKKTSLSWDSRRAVSVRNQPAAPSAAMDDVDIGRPNGLSFGGGGGKYQLGSRQRIAGYGGFIPHIGAQSVWGKTFADAQDEAFNKTYASYTGIGLDSTLSSPQVAQPHISQMYPRGSTA